MDSVNQSIYLLEALSLTNILKHLNTNTLKTVSANKGISQNDLINFTPYENFQVSGKFEDDIYYTYLITDDSNYVKLQLKKIIVNSDPDIVVFTTDDVDQNNEKKRYTYKLQLLKTKNFEIDITQTERAIQNRITRYTRDEQSLIQKKQKIEEKWNEELTRLYEQKKTLILENKKLYIQHLREEEIPDRKEYIGKYHIELKKSDVNKNSILEINKQIDLLERKKNLYLSKLYYYDPTSLLIVTSLEKEEYKELNKSSIKLGGHYKNKVQYELEYLDLDNLNEELDNNSYYKKLKTTLRNSSKKYKTFSNKDIFQKVHSVV